MWGLGVRFEVKTGLCKDAGGEAEQMKGFQTIPAACWP